MSTKPLTSLVTAAIPTLLMIPLVCLTTSCITGKTQIETSITLPNETIQLPAGTNDFLAKSYCLGCHSADYVIYQPPQDRAQWQEVLTKMQVKFNVPAISATNESMLLDYLVEVNGTGL